MLDDRIYQTFLEEMESLKVFRETHSSLYRETPLELVEDPDTMRLVEALAFFSARNRLQGIHSIAQIHQQLFHQYFSFLVNPLPAMGLLRIHPSLRLPESQKISEEMELTCSTYDGRKAAFQTLRSLTLTALFLQKFDFSRRQQGGWRLKMTYFTPHINGDQLGMISFYINHLNSFFGSLRAYFALSRSLEEVLVHYDEPDPSGKKGLLCEMRFAGPEQRKVFNHPLEYLRSQLHFPEQEMFIALQVPTSQTKWRTVTFCFELNEKWPEGLILSKDSLALHVVPIVNLKTARAEPIECDGIKDSYPILYSNPSDQFKLHTVLSVSEVVAGGMKPLKPGILDTQSSTYEIDFFREELLIDFPNAFEHPRTVSVEALWIQLWFSDYIDEEFKIRFSEERYSSLDVSLLQQLRSHEIAILAKDPNYLIRILALKNQNKLNLSELLFLMNSLKNINHSYFKTVPPLIKSLEVQQQIDSMGLGPTVVYQFQLKEWDGRGWELVVLFFKYVHSFLNCWLSNFHVELRVFFPNVKTPLIYKGEMQDEFSILARDFYLP